MIRNYIKIALRNLMKNRLYALINVLGITISTVVVLISATYIAKEYSYDTFHKDTGKKYRLLKKRKSDGELYANIPASFYSRFEQIPGLTKIERLIRYPERPFRYEDDAFVAKILFADTTFFDFFNFGIKTGSEEAFKNGTPIFLTESFAKKIFGNEDPIGKTIWYDNKLQLSVSGVLEDIPGNSHLQFDFLAPNTALKQVEPWVLNNPNVWASLFYFQVNKKEDIPVIEEKINEALVDVLGEKYMEYNRFILQPFQDIYLHSAQVVNERIQRGNILHVVFIGIAALLILIISCFNYININLTLLNKRMKEITLRKIVGASRKQLLFQFYFEALAVSFLAVWLGVIASELVLPPLNNYLGLQLKIQYELLAIIIFGLLLLLPVIISIYPAMLYTSFKPAQLLRKEKVFALKLSQRKVFNINFRYSLLILQFVIATLILTATIIIFGQMRFLTEQELGYEKEHRLVIENPYNDGLTERYFDIKREALSNPDIKNITAGFNIPSSGMNNYASLQCTDHGSRNISIGLNSVDFNFFNTIGAMIVEGRNFDEKNRSDSMNALVLSRQGIKSLGLESPYLGKKFKGLYDTTKTYELIGVVEDIHFWSKKEEVSPVAFIVRGNDYPSYAPKIIAEYVPGKYQEVVEFFRTQMQELAPQFPFIYRDLDMLTDKMYESENQLFSLFKILSFLSILLVILGLTGIVLLNLEKRKKEIGIRKVLGAKSNGIVKLILNNFMVMVTIGFITGCPLVYWIMQQWLQNFVYRIGISFWFFVTTAIILYFVAALLIVLETVRTLKSNPVEVLKYE